MSEDNQKVNKRRIVSKERLLAMERMRQAKAAKALERKNAELEPKVDAKVEQKPEQKIEEEEVSEDEVPIVTPKSRKKMTAPFQPLYGLQEEIQRYVEAALPPEFSRENRKKQKWEMRKKEIRDEILQQLQPFVTPPQPSKEPPKNEKNATLDINDLFF